MGGVDRKQLKRKIEWYTIRTKIPGNAEAMIGVLVVRYPNVTMSEPIICK